MSWTHVQHSWHGVGELGSEGTAGTPPSAHAAPEQQEWDVGLREGLTEVFTPGGRILLCFPADPFHLGFSSMFLL